ncbi:MAG: hypothetical protein R3349_06505 [Geminicoccaceae bacterium]|nr:hypothetical protein [Geminicoccaceae bacterium]
MMRTTPVDVPPYLLAPVMFTSWMCLAPLLAFQTAVRACGHANERRPAAVSPATATPVRADRPRDPKLDPTPEPSAGNVVNFPTRGRRRSHLPHP